jgi:ElaB/YqjD/DUF883 family membrane-anchored ribosome-binding protein
MKNTMKKISAMLVLSIFVIGMVPVAVFAQNTNAQVKKLNKEFLTKASVGKNQYQKTRNELKSDINSLHNVLKDVRNRGEATRDDAEKIKQRLLNFLDSVINHAERTKTAVANSCVDNENGNEFLDRVIDWAEDLKVDVEAIDPDTATREDLNKIIRKVKGGYDNVKGIVYTSVGRAVACKYRHLDEGLEKLIGRIIELTDQAEANGKNVDAARAWITEAEHRLDALETDWENIASTWRQVENANDVENIAKKSNRYLKNAASVVRQSYKEAKRVVNDLRNQ